MRFGRVGGLDLPTAALIVGGACLVALSIVTAVVLLSPPKPAEQTPPPPTPVPLTSDHPSQFLPSDRVATVLNIDAGSGAGGVARPGDHVDVLGYLSRQITGGDAATRVLVQDAQVLGVDRSGSAVALTLAVPQDAALLLQESQALGARPLVTLRPTTGAAEMPSAFTDSDLARRLAGAQ